MAATKSALKPAPKSLPFEIDAKYDILNVLKHRHTIPYHSRPFMWTRNEYIKFLMEDTLKSWRENMEHWMGFFIVYSDGIVPAISDAQHRATLCWLMFRALAASLTMDGPLRWISRYGIIDSELDEVDPVDQEVLEKYGWTRYPNIESCYEQDFEALGNILNDVPRPKDSDSLIYDAYETVKSILGAELPTREDQLSFLRFKRDSVKVTLMRITEWGFTMRAFVSLNNIKVKVPPSILLKNMFATAIGMDRSGEIHDMFCELKRAHSRNFEQYIHIQTNLFTKSLRTFEDYERSITEVLAPAAVLSGVCPFAAFCDSVRRADEAQTRLNSIPAYKLLPLILKSHEATTLYLLPLAYVAGAEQHAEVKRAVNELIAFEIRCETVFSFNPMTVHRFLREKMNPLLQGSTTVTATVNSINEQFRIWLREEGLSNDHVTARIAAECFSRSAFGRARCMLLFQAEMTDSHESSLIYDAIHIDHIYPKTHGKTCASLADPERRHRIGNLTPFIGKNSGSVTGNSGLGNKPFDKKAPEYTKSNIAMTREVAARYGSTGFMDAQIEERSHTLATQIAALTAGVLGL